MRAVSGLTASLSGLDIYVNGAGRVVRVSTIERSDLKAVSGPGKTLCSCVAQAQQAATDGLNTTRMTPSGKGFMSDPGKTLPPQ